MSLALAEFTEKLVAISDFSQGKAGKIFNDVHKNNAEYIVLKNNQPTAVVVSVDEYRQTQKKIALLEKMLEVIENRHLLSLAEGRKDSSTIDFTEFLQSEGLSLEELESIADSVEIE